MMSRLPVYVSEDDIAEMFSVADRDQDGRISYNEFLVNDRNYKILINKIIVYMSLINKMIVYMSLIN